WRSYAVTKTTSGIASAPTSSMMSNAVARPSFTSSRATSGRRSTMAATASSRRPQTSMRPISGSFSSSRRRPSRARGSSSTMRTFIRSYVHTFIRSYGDRRRDEREDQLEAHAGRVEHFAPSGDSNTCAVAIELAKPRARVAQSDPLAQRSVAEVRGAGVFDDDEQTLINPRRGDGDTGSTAVVLAVLDRVFHEWLKEKDWNTRVDGVGIDRDPNIQPVAESNAHDVQVLVEEGQLLGQRDFVRLLVQ